MSVSVEVIEIDVRRQTVDPIKLAIADIFLAMPKLPVTGIFLDKQGNSHAFSRTSPTEGRYTFYPAYGGWRQFKIKVTEVRE